MIDQPDVRATHPALRVRDFHPPRPPCLWTVRTSALFPAARTCWSDFLASSGVLFRGFRVQLLHPHAFCSVPPAPNLSADQWCHSTVCGLLTRAAGGSGGAACGRCSCSAAHGSALAALALVPNHAHAVTCFPDEPCARTQRACAPGCSPLCPLACPSLAFTAPPRAYAAPFLLAAASLFAWRAQDSERLPFPLYAACAQGHAAVVDVLLRAGADVHRTTVRAAPDRAGAAVPRLFPSQCTSRLCHAPRPAVPPCGC